MRTYSFIFVLISILCTSHYTYAAVDDSSIAGTFENSANLQFIIHKIGNKLYEFTVKGPICNSKYANNIIRTTSGIKTGTKLVDAKSKKDVLLYNEQSDIWYPLMPDKWDIDFGNDRDECLKILSTQPKFTRIK